MLEKPPRKQIPVLFLPKKIAAAHPVALWIEAYIRRVFINLAIWAIAYGALSGCLSKNSPMHPDNWTSLLDPSSFLYFLIGGAIIFLLFSIVGRGSNAKYWYRKIIVTEICVATISMCSIAIVVGASIGGFSIVFFGLLGHLICNFFLSRVE